VKYQWSDVRCIFCGVNVRGGWRSCVCAKAYLERQSEAYQAGAIGTSSGRDNARGKTRRRLATNDPAGLIDLDDKSLQVTRKPPAGSRKGKDPTLEQREGMLAEAAAHVLSQTKGAPPEGGSAAERIVGREVAAAYRELRNGTLHLRQKRAQDVPASVPLGIVHEIQRHRTVFRLIATHAAEDPFDSLAYEESRDGIVRLLWRLRRTHAIDVCNAQQRVKGDMVRCTNASCGARHRLVDRFGRSSIRPQERKSGCPRCGHMTYQDIPAPRLLQDSFSPAPGGRRLTKAYLRRRFRISPQVLERILRPKSK